ncbi:MAG: DUF364 domain-containing protein [Hyphomicrobium sp.]
MLASPASVDFRDLLVAKVAGKESVAQELCIGLTWTACKTATTIGLAMSPTEKSRTLQWPGTLVGKKAADLAAWIGSWNFFEASVGLSAINAVVNAPGNALMGQAQPLANGNLSVFEHFRPQLVGKRVGVVGRYPGLARVLNGLDVRVLERMPGEEDLPDTSAEYVLPECDWVFLTATSLINKTFPRLAELSRRSVTVLMGPSCPWLSDWREFGIDIVAGVQVIDPTKTWQVVLEGGGTRLFDEGVRYAVADLRTSR